MARKNAKKQPEAHKIDCAEVFASLRDLEKIKGIPVEYMVERLKQALTNAYRKDREDHRDIPAENVVVGISEEGLTMHQIKTVVDELTDLALEIHIDAAHRINPDLKVGDTVAIAIDIQKFGRIAAQTAKQVVIQGIREAERGMVYESYSSKTQELLTGILHNRLGRVVSKAAGLSLNGAAADLTQQELQAVCTAVKSFEVPLTEPMGMDSAQVTAGGILTEDFDPCTMESKLVPGLYACGEVLDIDGDCGGFNLQWAWSSGILAGRSAAEVEK